MQAMVDIIATASRIDMACPTAPSRKPATFGSMKEMLWPAIKVKEI